MSQQARFYSGFSDEDGSIEVWKIVPDTELLSEIIIRRGGIRKKAGWFVVIQILKRQLMRQKGKTKKLIYVFNNVTLIGKWVLYMGK